LSNPSILKAASAPKVQAFATMLPTVLPSAIQAAVSREGRGGRTANQLEQLRQTIMNEAYDEGYSRGVEAGTAEGYDQAYADAYAKAKAEADEISRAMLDRFAADLQGTVQSVFDALENWTRSAETDLTAIVSHIAEQVLQTELGTSRESILAIVKHAIAEATHSEFARIRINPLASEILNENKAAIIAAAKSIRKLELVEDEAIAGGCVIETDGGIIDATIEGKLNQFREELGDAA